MIQFVELFCGIGGFRLGLEQANQENREQVSSSSNGRKEIGDSGNELLRGERDNGCSGWTSKKYTCVWANDNDKYASHIYRNQFGTKELVEADIRTVNVDSIPDHDLLTAGFPCQSFSVAGKRLGFQDTRGTLFYEICRVAKAKRPPLLLLENVRGLLSHDEGLTFQVILESLAELGYWCEWQVLNSKHHGVPQNRQRVFIIGHLTGTGGREIFPLFKNGEEYNSKPIQGNEITSTLRANYRKNPERGSYINVTTEGNARTLQGGGHSGGLHSNMTAISENLISRFPLKFLSRNEKNYLKDEAYTVDSANTGGILQNSRIRRLTPVECERLQGFPDNWTSGVSDTQRYKCLGNAVTVNVIEFLGKEMADATSNKK